MGTVTFRTNAILVIENKKLLENGSNKFYFLIETLELR